MSERKLGDSVGQIAKSYRTMAFPTSKGRKEPTLLLSFRELWPAGKRLGRSPHPNSAKRKMLPREENSKITLGHNCNSLSRKQEGFPGSLNSDAVQCRLTQSSGVIKDSVLLTPC